QACRFGLDAVYVDPVSGEHMALRDHIVLTMKQIDAHAVAVAAATGIDLLKLSTDMGANDARWLRERQAKERLLAEVSRQAAERFRGARR
ncbi:MAG: glutamate--cysteine ligase, partial [Ramlibacter sp.]|nr:glutamate--cysteine ligase [Ramlibacter sp.]